MTLTKTLAALEAAEIAIRQIVPDDDTFDREILTLSDATRLSLAAHECRRIRVDLIRYFDPRNRNRDDSDE